MDNILQRIIEMEDKAQSIVREAKEHKRNFAEEIEKESLKIKEDIEARVTRKIKEIQEQESEYIQKRLTDIKDDITRKLDKMNKIYEVNRDKWINSVYERIMR